MHSGRGDDAVAFHIEGRGQRSAEAAGDIGHVLLLEDESNGAGSGTGIHGDVAPLAFVEHDEGGGRDIVMAALGADRVVILQRITQRQRADKGLRARTKKALAKRFLPTMVCSVTLFATAFSSTNTILKSFIREASISSPFSIPQLPGLLIISLYSLNCHEGVSKFPEKQDKYASLQSFTKTQFFTKLYRSPTWPTKLTQKTEADYAAREEKAARTRIEQCRREELAGAL